MKRNLKYIIPAILLSLLTTISIGYSIWIILSETVSNYVKAAGEFVFQPTASSFYADETWTTANADSATQGTIVYKYNDGSADKTVTLYGTYTIGTADAKGGDATFTATPTVTLVPSTWIAKTIFGDSISVTPTLTLNAVAKYGDDYYTTIDAALAAANTANSGTVYVIPSGNYKTETERANVAKTITPVYDEKGKEVTREIPSGVTLHIPYYTDTAAPWPTDCGDYDLDEGKPLDGTTHKGTGLGGVNQNAYNSFETYCTNLVSIACDITFGGPVEIDGICFLSPSFEISGHTCREFGALKLVPKSNGESATATFNGQVTCMGFIIADDEADCGNLVFNGQLIMPFVFYDWFAGDGTLGLRGGANENDKFLTSPIVRFTFANVVGKYRMNYDATLTAQAGIYVSTPKKPVIKQVDLVSTSAGFLQLNQETAYLDLEYDADTKIDGVFGKLTVGFHGTNAGYFVKNDATKADIVVNPFHIEFELTELFGGIGSAAPIDKIVLSSNGLYLPVSYLLDFTFHSGGFYYLGGQNLKILRGATVKIESGAIVQMADLLVYDYENYPSWGDDASYKYPKWVSGPAYPATANNGALLVGGTLYADSIGGLVQACGAGAHLEFSIKQNDEIEYEILQAGEIDDTFTDPPNCEVSGCDSHRTGKLDLIFIEAGKTVHYRYVQIPVSLPSYFAYADSNQNYKAAGIYYSAQTAGANTPDDATDDKYAWYNPSFEVKFDANGGDFENPSASTFSPPDSSYDGHVPLPEKPTLRYYTFSHWCTDQNCTEGPNSDCNVFGDNGFSKQTYFAAPASPFYAAWTPLPYTLKYVYVLPNGTTASSGLSDTTFTVETPSIALKASSELSKPTGTNYSFSGWFTAPENGTQITAISGREYAEIADANNGIVTIYAVWTDGVVYDIEYKVPSVGDFYPLPSETSVKVVAGETVTFAPPTQLSSGESFATVQNDPTRQYYFGGWYVDEDYTTPYQDWNQLLGVLAEGQEETYQRTLYGRWIEKEICITLAVSDASPAGAAIATGSRWFNAGQTFTLPSATTTPTGYAFLGWYDAASGGTPITENPYSPTDGVILYARWQGCTVTYNANNGTVSPASATYAGKALTLPTPERSGYRFNGWYTEASGGTEVGNAGDTYTPEEDITLYAQWSKYYTITVSTNNATVSGVKNNQQACAGDVIKFTVSYDQSGDQKTTVTDANGNTITTTGSYTFTMPASDVTISSSSSCIVEGTLITMADGTQKPVEDLKVGDMILAFNHVTGKLEAAPLIFNTHSQTEAADYNVLYLNFSDGSEVKIVASHGFFDMTLMKYVYITEKNYEQFIGHEFYALGADGSGKIITLTDAHISREYVRIFCPVTYFHMNSFANGLLNTPNIPGDITGLVNYFEYDSDLKYNEESMAADIEKYGLYSYEDFSDYISYEAYLSSPAVYLKVSVGKGMMTYEEIIDVILYLLEGSLIDSDISQ